MASAAGSGTSTLGLTSILPPRCIANTGSSSRSDRERERIASSATVTPKRFLPVTGLPSPWARGGEVGRRPGRGNGDDSRYGGCPCTYCAISGLLLALSAPVCNTHQRGQPITQLFPPQRRFARGPVILC